DEAIDLSTPSRRETPGTTETAMRATQQPGRWNPMTTHDTGANAAKILSPETGLNTGRAKARRAQSPALSRSKPEPFDVLILGSGQGGKLLAWHMARAGHRTAVVERKWVGGSCPAVACMPSKNEIWSARVAHLARTADQFGTMTGAVRTDMAKVRDRKQR